MAEPREALAAALVGYLTEEQVKILIDEVLAIKKKAPGDFTCKKCGAHQRQYVEIPDAKAVALALPDLLNQAFGRPDVAVTQNDPIQFYRLTNLEEVDALRPDRRAENDESVDG